MHAESNLYVQYGCGLCAPVTWRNFDASPTLRLQRLPFVGRYIRPKGHPVFPLNVEYGDIVKGLPIPLASCKAIYCSHVLEHLALTDFRVALENTLAHLQPGGVFRFVVPDLEQMARTYVASDDPAAAISFIEQTRMGMQVRPRRPRELLRRWLGSSFHLWMWDYKSLAAELTRAGFQHVRRAERGDSADSRFIDVEDAHRWNGSVGIECTKGMGRS